ncbi:Salicylate carboxymethyltransferase, partial [Bienertia sinuspersici]
MAIKELYFKEQPSIAIICIADFSCSSAELNNLSVVSELIHSIEKARRNLGNGKQQDYQVYLNDHPNNDFNTIFRYLSSFKINHKQEMGDDFGHCFVSGVHGSFYGRLFPNKHLHLVPKGIEDNKENIYIARTTSPDVLKAYYDRFEKDFSTFL